MRRLFLIVFPFSIIRRGQLHSSSSSGVGRRIERSTSIGSSMLLASHRLVLGIDPAGQGFGDEADDSEEESEESKRLSSMFDGYLDTRGGVEEDVAVVVALGGEDECRQPQVGENHVNQSNPLAEYSRLERREESRDEEDYRKDGNDEVEDCVCAMVLAVHKVGVETHGDDGADPLHGSGGQEEWPGDG